jgi:carboxyl-terminal processing protease
MSKLLPTLYLATSLALLGSSTSWSEVAPAPAEASPTQTRLPVKELRRFTDAFEKIRRTYVEEIDDATLLDSAIHGMLQRLDPHSVYLEPEPLAEIKEATTGEFGGLGLEVGMDQGFIRVISPVDDTPAHKAGVEAGDFIIKLDDKPVRGMGLNEAVSIMRGDKGTPITLTIMREGEEQPLEIEIIRDIIKVQSVRSRMLEAGYGYLRIAQFQVNTGEQIREQLTKLREESDEFKGAILDLRNNPGGVLQAAVDVSGVFLDGGLVVYTEGRQEGSDTRFNAEAGDHLAGKPVVVMINGGSASASEIVAGALQDHRRAVVLGTESFGKGSVQSILPLDEERALKLTTALYFTPGGRSIQAQGISPDVVVERARVEKLAPSRNITEADLSGHLGNANGGEESDTTKRKAKQSSALLESDNQLHAALNLLKGIHVLSTEPVLENKASAEETEADPAMDSPPELEAAEEATPAD